jgi:hypothetical protein
MSHIRTEYGVGMLTTEQWRLMMLDQKRNEDIRKQHETVGTSTFKPVLPTWSRMV